MGSQNENHSRLFQRGPFIKLGSPVTHILIGLDLPPLEESERVKPLEPIKWRFGQPTPPPSFPVAFKKPER